MANGSIDTIRRNGCDKRSIPMGTIVVSHPSYREYRETADRAVFESPFVPRETLPVRAAIRDYDLDPPLTHKGLIDAVHTGRSM